MPCAVAGLGEPLVTRTARLRTACLVLVLAAPALAGERLVADGYALDLPDAFELGGPSHLAGFDARHPRRVDVQHVAVCMVRPPTAC